jgi:hypothetical protein
MRRHDGAFCLLLALLLLAARVVIIDHRILSVTSIPLHDMFHGTAFVATSLHSLRLDGDIAWWNPISQLGYAQYYLGFFSPMAPTYGNVVFVAWSWLALGLAHLNVLVPEYIQYVVLNYLVFVLLAFVAFLWFCSQLFAHRATVALAGIVFAFSGIGLWNSAWFYFQEAFTFFFLAGTAIGALQRPVPARIALLALATVIQTASFNYWTLYNSWFALVLFGSYAAFHGNQVRRLGRRLLALVKRSWAWKAALVGTAITLVVWAGLIATVAGDQASAYDRFGQGFGIEDALEQIPGMVDFASRLFNPTADTTQRFSWQIMHNARYLGATLLPLLVLLTVQRWGRRERWLAASALGVAVVCVGHPLLLAVWTVIPGMNRIRHLFYFYTHHLQLLLLLLAAASLQSLLERRVRSTTRRALLRTAVGTAVMLAFVLVELVVASAWLPNQGAALGSAFSFTLLAGVSAVLLGRFVVAPTSVNRRVLVGTLLVLTAVDLTRYFWIIERADLEFTATKRFQAALAEPLPQEVQDAFRRPWPLPDLAGGFQGGLARVLPVESELWPNNRYVTSKRLFERVGVFGMLGIRVIGEPPPPPTEPTFFPSTRVVRGGDEVPSDDEQVDVSVLRVESEQVAPESAPGSRSRRTHEPLAYRFRKWSYNGFTIDIDVPGDGWLLLPQLFDPAWAILVDGRREQPARADHAFLAIPVSAGPRTITMDYRPLARSLYWPATVLLGLTCALLVGLAVASRQRLAGA